MRVLVTGSAGFIGSAIVETLADVGIETVRVDLVHPAAHGDAPAPAGTQVLDVREAATDRAWAQALDGVDVVCHQAALVGAGTSVADLPAYAGHNDLGTAALLAAMAARGVDKLLLASSMVVYGEGRYACEEHGERLPGTRPEEALDAGRFENPCPVCGRDLGWLPVSEEAPLRPRSSYAASKVAQEHYAAAWARQAGGSAIALRYHNVYGPGMPRDTPYSGVAAMFRSSLEREERPQVYEDGRQVRDFVHVADIAAANLAATRALAGSATGALAAYNVASGHPVTIGEVARALGGVYGVAPQITGRHRAGDVRHIVASPGRAARELGFTAAVTPADGLRRFATAPLRPTVAGVAR